MEERKRELRKAIRDCRDRGLFNSAKWAAVQLAGLPLEQDSSSEAHMADVANAEPVDDQFELARTLFDVKEYYTVAHTLSSSTNPRSLFLKLYALYLAGERRKDAVRDEKSGALSPTAGNSELEAIYRALIELQSKGMCDGFLLYLLGVVLIDKNKREEARNALVASVNAYPCNWAAWKALQSACSEYDLALNLPLPDHYIKNFFLAALAADLQRNAEALEQLQSLSAGFPRSEDIILLAALAHNNLRNYDEAHELFDTLLRNNPYRIEGMDIFSNILYVKEEVVTLSHLAHRCVNNDKYRPETCCVIGNYYSLRGQHERAVTYFRRALKLDPGFLPAWTLMGHEYVELKNPPAAIEAYRRAVDVNPRDYRAWYGLGQTYELVNMPQYALYYFRRAVSLRPEDARMWNAMGHCYQSDALGAYEEAIACHRRALPHDREGVAVHQLARLHAGLGQRREAAHYHRLNLERIDKEGLTEGQDAVDALTYLAEWHRDIGELEAAEEYYTRLLDYGISHTREQAKANLVQIRKLMEGRNVGGGVGGIGSPGSDMGITPDRG